MTALDALRALDESPFVKEVTSNFNRAKRAARPYMPVITRVLLISAFVEDAFRTLLEYKHQVAFFRNFLGIPGWLAFPLIGTSSTVTFVGAAMLFLKKAEKRGGQLLIGATIYQQVIYGRHSPITSGNFGFLVRNMCLIGTLMLLMSNQRIKDGLPALPGIPDMNSKKDGGRDTVALFTRLLLGLLCIEMFDVIGWLWGIIIIPIALLMLIGYKTDVMGLFLMLFYVIATLTSKPFWNIQGDHPMIAFQRDVMRYEFLQTMSIMSGLVMLIMTGPGALSLDDKLKRGKAW